MARASARSTVSGIMNILAALCRSWCAFLGFDLRASVEEAASSEKRVLVQLLLLHRIAWPAAPRRLAGGQAHCP
jgi:hypothetical protein